jgi:hypothetical protein
MVNRGDENVNSRFGVAKFEVRGYVTANLELRNLEPRSYSTRNRNPFRYSPSGQ